MMYQTAKFSLSLSGMGPPPLLTHTSTPSKVNVLLPITFSAVEDPEEVLHLQAGVVGEVCAVHSVPHLVAAKLCPEGVGAKGAGDLWVHGTSQLPEGQVRRPRRCRCGSNLNGDAGARAQLLHHGAVLGDHALVDLQELFGVGLAHVMQLERRDGESGVRYHFDHLSRQSVEHRVRLHDAEGGVGEASRGFPARSAIARRLGPASTTTTTTTTTITSEKELRLAGGRGLRIRPVTRVASLVRAELRPDGPGSLLSRHGRIRGPEDLPPPRYRVLSRDFEGHDGTLRHEAHQLLEERLPVVLGVELLGFFLGQPHHLGLGYQEPFARHAVEDLADFGGAAVWLDDAQGLLLLRPELPLGELVPVLRDAELAGVDVDHRPHEQVLKGHALARGSLQEQLPGLEVDHLARVVRRVVVEQVAPDQCCIGVVPLRSKCVPLFHFFFLCVRH